MEHLESDNENSISDDEEPETEHQILQQFATREYEQQTSSRSNKGTITSTRFEDEDFSRKPQIHQARIAKNIDPNDEAEPITIQEALNHRTHRKQWEQAIRDEYNSLIKNHTCGLPQTTRSLAAKCMLCSPQDQI